LVILNDFQMAGFTGVTATNARSAAASRALVADGNEKNAVALCFRQRHGGGRCVPAPLQPSLRLHFTLPLAEPLTEACRWLTQLSQIILRRMAGLACWWKPINLAPGEER
jgi:hypothetical protein